VARAARGPDYTVPTASAGDKGLDDWSDADYQKFLEDSAAKHESPKTTARRHEREQRAGALEADRATKARAATSSARRASASSYGRSVGKGLSQVPGATGQILRGRLPATPAGAVCGLLGAALLVNWLEGGWPQVKGWLGAKFLNKVPSAPAAAATTSVTVATPAPAAVVPPGTVAV
jgi:hypothetical protein